MLTRMLMRNDTSTNREETDNNIIIIEDHISKLKFFLSDTGVLLSVQNESVTCH